MAVYVLSDRRRQSDRYLETLKSELAAAIVAGDKAKIEELESAIAEASGHGAQSPSDA